MEVNRTKLEALVQYICWSCDPHELGKVKLHKTLWYSDLNAYLLRGVPITGESYRKDRHGPVAAHLDQTLSALQRRGALKISRDEGYGRKWEFLRASEPDMRSFDREEIWLIDNAIREVCTRSTANRVSKQTHDRIWEIAGLGEEIPLSTALVSKLDEVTDDDIEWAQHVEDDGQ